MIDGQTATSFTFAANDSSPTAIIDLGKESKLRRVSAIYTPHKGTVDFYVLKSLPLSRVPKTTNLRRMLCRKERQLARRPQQPPPQTSPRI